METPEEDIKGQFTMCYMKAQVISNLWRFIFTCMARVILCTLCRILNMIRAGYCFRFFILVSIFIRSDIKMLNFFVTFL